MAHRLTVMAGLLLVLSMLLAACGEADLDDTPANGAGSPADPTSTASATETPAPDQLDLDGTSWQLSGFGNSDLDIDVEVTLSFSDGEASGNAGCNDFGSPYTSASDGTLSFTEIYNTEMDCEIGMEVEQAYLDALDVVDGYSINDDRLELLDADGDMLLVFTRDEVALDGTQWLLVELAGEPLPSAVEATLNFNDGQAGGEVCNAYGGDYELGSDGTLTISDVFRTEMYCEEPEGVMDVEEAYVSALNDVTSYRIESGQLKLLDADDESLMTFEPQDSAGVLPLESTSWIVTELDGEALIDDTEISITFEDGSLTGNSGCNTFGGAYTGTAGGDLELYDLGMTLMSCMEPDGVMDQETAFHDALRVIDSYEMTDTGANLLDAGGTVRITLGHPDEPAALTDLAGTDWVLVAMNGQQVESALPYTLQFTVNGPTGKAGCMVYSSMFEARPSGTLSEEVIYSHDLQCDGDEALIAEAETYIEVLDQATNYIATEDYLQLMNEQGETTMEFRPGQAGGELDGTSWVLTSMNGEPPIEGTEITLQFEYEWATGEGGCNGYGGPYMVVDPGLVIFHGAGHTDMGCEEPPGIMDQESEYVDTLVRVVNYEMTDDSLTLRDMNGAALLTFDVIPADNDLYRTYWSLTSIEGAALVEDSMIQIRFGARAASGYDSCSMYYSSYERADDDSLVFINIGPQEATCPNDVPGIADQRSAYMSALSDVVAYRLSGASLELLNASGETILIFDAVS